MKLLQKKDFVVKGVFRPRDKRIEDEKVFSEAMEWVNKWLNENSEIELINVESVYISPSQPMGTTAAELKFIRVWFY